MPSDRPVQLLDQGAQAERTSLAWQRTGLGLVATGALLLHSAPSGPEPLALVPGLALLLLGVLVTAVVGPMRYRQIVRAVQDGRSPTAPRSLVVPAMLVFGMAAVLVAALVVT